MPNNPTGQKSPLFPLIDRFAREFADLSDKLTPIIEAELAKGIAPRTAVNRAFKQVGVSKAIRASLLEKLVTATAIGYTSDFVADPKAIQSVLLHKVYPQDKFTLSERIVKKEYQKQATSSIVQELKKGTTYRDLAKNFTDKDIVQGKLPKHLDSLIKQSRVSITDPKFKASLQKSIRAIDRMAQRGAPNKALQAQYSELVRKIQTGTEKQVANGIKHAIREKARYNAERIARTEIARAYGAGQDLKNAEDPDVIGVKFRLSSRHPERDICFPENTMVMTPTGNRPIQELKIGDKVLTHKGKYQKILKKYVRNYSGSLSHTLLKGEIVHSVLSTPNHPFLTDQGWVPASGLKTGSHGIYCSEQQPELLHQLFGDDSCKGGLYSQENGVIRALKNTFLELCGEPQKVFFRKYHKNVQRLLKPIISFFEGFCGSHQFPHPSNSGSPHLSVFQKVFFGILGYAKTFLFFFCQSLGFLLPYKMVCNRQSRIYSLNGVLPQKTFHTFRRFVAWLYGGFGSKNYCRIFAQFLFRNRFSNVFSRKLGKVLLSFLSVLAYKEYTKSRRIFHSGTIENDGEIPFQNCTVYNIEVESDNTYFANNIAVHNCDFHTGANLYGMGKGVYPKNRHPRYPFHPHCMCVMNQVFVGEATVGKFNRKNGDKYLKSQSADMQEKILGVGGRKKWQKGGKWESNASNYTGQEKVVIGGKNNLKKKMFVDPKKTPVRVVPVREFVKAETVKEAVQFSKSLGVQLKLSKTRPKNFFASGKSDLDIANKINRDLIAMTKKQITLPPIVKTKNLSVKKQNGVGGYFRPSEPNTVTLNNNFYPLVDDEMATFSRKQNTMSTGSLEHILAHETGHLLHYKKSEIRFRELAKTYKESDLLGSNTKIIRDNVSNYASTDPLELVAEVFVGMKNGVKYPESIMKLYKLFGGI